MLSFYIHIYILLSLSNLFINTIEDVAEGSKQPSPRILIFVYDWIVTELAMKLSTNSTCSYAIANITLPCVLNCGRLEFLCSRAFLYLADSQCWRPLLWYFVQLGREWVGEITLERTKRLVIEYSELNNGWNRMGGQMGVRSVVSPIDLLLMETITHYTSCPAERYRPKWWITEL